MKIGLIDHMGYGNLGDAATQDAVIASLREHLPTAELIGFSLNPEDTQWRHGIPCYCITYWDPGMLQPDGTAAGDDAAQQGRLISFAKRVPLISTPARRLLHVLREMRHLRRTFRVVRSLDVLIFAGGGQLGEMWRGPWAHPYNVLKFSLMTKLAGKRLIFLNVGAGPLKRPLSRRFIRWAVNLADYVSLRDAESQALVEGLGVKRATYVFPDSVYILDAPQGREVPSARPVVGINPIGFCDPRIWPKTDPVQYAAYLDKVTEFCVWLAGHGYQVRMFSSEMSVDVHALADLRDRLSARLAPEDLATMFPPPRTTVKGLLDQMAEVDFVVTSKFHGVVFSHLLLKPVIALSYHPKIDHLMRACGQDEYCLNIEDFELDVLQHTFTRMVGDAPGLRSKFRAVCNSYAKALREQFDSLFAGDALQSPLYNRGRQKNDAPAEASSKVTTA